MMPRMLVAVALTASIGCRFDADYAGGHYACSDGVCPAGLACNSADECVPPSELDAQVPDGPPPALDCSEPGVIIPGAERTFTGDTTGDSNDITAPCDSRNMFGPEDVYAGTAIAGDPLHVIIESDDDVAAYVIITCAASPPTCLGNSLATPGFPLDIPSLAAGNFYVVVDSELALGGGPYTLRVTLGP
jgi:hypothetical protein